MARDEVRRLGSFVAFSSDSEWTQETAELGPGALPDETADLPGGEPGPEPSLRGLKAFGPYRALRLLGKGGMGAVFEVEHLDLGVRYALKTILGAPGNPEYRRRLARFEREAELGARLDHPRIVTVRSADLAALPPYLVVDLVHGGSLGERLDEAGTIPLSEGITLGLELADALRYAHERGVLHRDLKPDNVMIDEAGSARLVDFGLALGLERETRLTRSGVALGTPLTMAPEQLRGTREESPATDVYGLAATLFWALAGEPPLGLECENLPELMLTINEEEPPPLERYCPLAPRSLCQLLRESLRKEPAQRPSLERWIHVLESLAEGQDPSPSSAPRLSIPLLLLLLLSLLLLAGAAITLFALRDPGPKAVASPTPTASSSPRLTWQRTLATGSRAAALRRFGDTEAPLLPADAPLAASLLERAGTDEAKLAPAALDRLEGRLEALSEEDRAALWSLACLVNADLPRARRHTRLGSVARSLIDLEALRAKLDRREVLPRLGASVTKQNLGARRELFGQLTRAAQSWPQKRVANASTPTQRLAAIVLDRLQGTIGRFGLALRLAERSVGAKRHAHLEATLVSQALPESEGPGRVLLELFVGNEAPTQADSSRQIRLQTLAARYETLFLRDVAGRVLLGAHAARYALDPARGLALGSLACNEDLPQETFAGQAQRIFPDLIARQIEVDYLGGDAGLTRVALQAFLHELQTVDRKRNKRQAPALISWLLSQRELTEAVAQLELVRRKLNVAGGHGAKVALLRGELMLAQDPAGAADAVVELLEGRERFYLEEYGLLAHALALLGKDPGPALEALERGRGVHPRLGLPWHSFKASEVIEGRAWWPGLPRPR